MQAIDSLLALLLFGTPGFVAMEVANTFSSKRALGYTDRDRLCQIVIFGVASFCAASVALGTTFGKLWETFSNPDRILSGQLAWLYALAVIFGFLWAAVREAWPRLREATQRVGFNLGLFAFTGNLPVWNDIVQHGAHDSWRAQVTTRHGRIYVGKVFTYPTQENDRDLILSKVWMAVIPEGGVLPDAATYQELGPDLVFLAGADIVAVRIMPATTFLASVSGAQEEAATVPAQSEPLSREALPKRACFRRTRRLSGQRVFSSRFRSLSSSSPLA